MRDVSTAPPPDPDRYRPATLLLEHLEAGLALGILSETAEPPDDFQFTHELVRRALYAGLSRVRRRRLQRAVADAPEHRSGGAGAGSRGDASGRAGDEDGALELALRSLGHAERLCSWEEAIRQCRTALDLLRRRAAPDVEGEIQLLDRLAALYFGRVQTFAAGACLRDALQLCERIGLPVRRVVLMARLAALGPSWCSVDTAEALFDQIVRAAPDLPSSDHGALFDAHLELGLAHQRHGRVTAALPYIRSACEMADPADWARHTLGQYALGAILISTGNVVEAASVLRVAMTSLDSGMAVQWDGDDDLIHWRDPRRTRCLVLAELARALDLLGQTDEAERLAQAAREEEVRFGVLGGRAHRAFAQIELRRGRPAAALRMLSANSDEAAPGSLGMRRAADLVLVSAAHLALGNVALALETASEGVSICIRSRAGESLSTSWRPTHEPWRSGERLSRESYRPALTASPDWSSPDAVRRRQVGLNASSRVGTRNRMVRLADAASASGSPNVCTDTGADAETRSPRRLVSRPPLSIGDGSRASGPPRLFQAAAEGGDARERSIVRTGP